ncbi:hypothetical protein LCGC14_2672480, partial [marine sediment metagenome]
PDVPAVRLIDQRGTLRRSVQHNDTRRAGIYKLTLKLPDETKTVMFARNVDPSEGRLARASEEELRGWLGVDFVYEDKLAPATAETAVRTPRGEYWKAALIAMLLVLAVEVFLGQRFGHYR